VNRRFLSAAVTGLTVMLLISWLSLQPVTGQGFWAKDTPTLPMARTWIAYKAKLPPYTPRRTPDGVPDLQGVWGGAGGAGADDIEEHGYVDVTTPPQESFIFDPPDGKIPYTAWGLAKRDEHRAGLARGWPGENGRRLHVDPNSFCVPMVGPRFANVEIIQQPGAVIMAGANVYRTIPTDGRPHIGSQAKFWLGNSRGRWDGDTLVVDITSLNGKHWFDSVGNYYTENTHMIERWRLVDANTIDYEIAIEDPTVYTRPWKMTFPKRRAGTGGTDPKTGKYDWRETAAPAPANNPYAREVWENNCRDGNVEHVQLTHELGFKWYKGVSPPR
jgi:hypothetical protein